MHTLILLARQLLRSKLSWGDTLLALSVGLMLSGIVQADDAAEAERWLQRMEQSNRQLSYQGQFVYLQAERFDALQIARQWRDGELRERIVALNGVPREILRVGEQVLCLTPSDGSLMLESQLVHGLFPAFNPEQWQQARHSYQLKLGGSERVAGQATQVIDVLPQQADRYAYRLWLAQETGLLLRAATLDEKRKPLSQMQFVEVDWDEPVATNLLEATQDAEHYLVLATSAANAEANAPAVAALDAGPQIELPSGFELRSSQMLSAPNNRALRLEQRVYSDGLSQLSIYIEELPDSSERFVQSNQQGALKFSSRQQGKYLITALGELPAPTLEQIVDSVHLTQTATEDESASAASARAADHLAGQQ